MISAAPARRYFEFDVAVSPLRDDGEMVSKRKAPPVPEQIKVWVRSGGHCTICHRYLLESGINYEVEKLGELAHIVGQSDGALAPRGLSHLSKSERNLAENLLLACAHCHNDIDKRLQAKRLDVHWLLMIKQRHEQRIRQATDLAASETPTHSEPR